MKFMNYVITAIILIAIGMLYNKFKIKMGTLDETDHYDLVRKYLLNDSSLATSKKPILWVHIEYDVNGRWWPSFCSRNTKCLNQPYFYLTLQTLINRCGDSFNIALIDDESFEKIIPGWTIKLNNMANPLREHFRKLALARTLHSYGGILVPPSFCCFTDLVDVYNKALSNKSAFIGEFIDRNNTATFTNFFPNTRLMGCKKKCPLMGDYVNFLQTTISSDNTNEMDFLGKASNWWFNKMRENKVNMISGSQLGVKDQTGKVVLIENLIGNNYIEFAPDTVGVYIPADELLRRTKYQWFCRLSPEQVLASETNIGKYLLLSCAL